MPFYRFFFWGGFLPPTKINKKEKKLAPKISNPSNLEDLVGERTHSNKTPRSAAPRGEFSPRLERGEHRLHGLHGLRAGQLELAAPWRLLPLFCDEGLLFLYFVVVVCFCLWRLPPVFWFVCHVSPRRCRPVFFLFPLGCLFLCRSLLVAGWAGVGGREGGWVSGCFFCYQCFFVLGVGGLP